MTPTSIETLHLSGFPQPQKVPTTAGGCLGALTGTSSSSKVSGCHRGEKCEGQSHCGLCDSTATCTGPNGVAHHYRCTAGLDVWGAGLAHAIYGASKSMSRSCEGSVRALEWHNSIVLITRELHRPQKGPGNFSRRDFQDPPRYSRTPLKVRQLIVRPENDEKHPEG